MLTIYIYSNIFILRGRWRDRISASGFPTDVLITPPSDLQRIHQPIDFQRNRQQNEKRNRQPTDARINSPSMDAIPTMFYLKSQFPMR